MDNYPDARPVKDVAFWKGYSAATIRKLCHSGRLNFVRKGRKMLVLVDEKYWQVEEKALGILRQSKFEMQKELKRLREENERLQLKFDFDKVDELEALREENKDLMRRNESLEAYNAIVLDKEIGNFEDNMREKIELNEKISEWKQIADDRQNQVKFLMKQIENMRGTKEHAGFTIFKC